MDIINLVSSQRGMQVDFVVRLDKVNIVDFSLMAQFKKDGAGGVILKIFGRIVFKKVVQVICYNQYFSINILFVFVGEFQLESDVMSVVVQGIVLVNCCWLIDVVDDQVQVVVVIQVIVGIVVVECWGFKVLVLVLVGKLQIVFIVEEGVLDWSRRYDFNKFFQYFCIFIDYGLYLGFISYIVEVVFIEQVRMDVIVDKDIL